MNKHQFTINVHAYSMLPPGLVAEAVARVVGEMLSTLEIFNPEIVVIDHGYNGADN